ncbi:uncharacterized protein BKA78DRAFT_291962 [Phyllosticta capitalensis]|uniref:uncharacterized protein n=1 Tax=Phyllosticta capitalensis TaxID=121624 RepID=UPI00312D3CD6
MRKPFLYYLLFPNYRPQPARSTPFSTNEQGRKRDHRVRSISTRPFAARAQPRPMADERTTKQILLLPESSRIKSTRAAPSQSAKTSSQHPRQAVQQRISLAFSSQASHSAAPLWAALADGPGGKAFDARYRSPQPGPSVRMCTLAAYMAWV